MEEACPALGCCRYSLSGFYRFSDHIDHDLRLRQHHHMTACDFGRRGAMRLARKRSQSGCMVRSFLATMYQLGFDFQAVPPTFALNRWSRHALRRPHQLLFLLRQIACEGMKKRIICWPEVQIGNSAFTLNLS